MRKLLAFILFNSLLLSQGNAADTTITIAAFGDSLFAGHGLAPEDAFPAQLEQKLKASGYNVTVINDGVNGDSTAGGLHRVDAVIDQQPDIVLLELGVNDLIHDRQIGIASQNLGEIIERLQKAQIKTVLIGQKAPFTNNNSGRDQSYIAMYPALASKYGVDLYPFFLEDIYDHPEFLQEDGVHPSKEGVTVLVNKFIPFLKDKAVMTIAAPQ